MPTADRRRFVPSAVRYFLSQDYPDKELLILDDGEDPIRDLIPETPSIRYFRERPGLTLGEKRNRLCDLAKGDLIVHWDDDDWMAPWRLTYQVRGMSTSQGDICGLRTLFYLDVDAGKAWRYVYPEDARPWLAGGTLLYRKAFWTRHPFPRLNIGEDTRFVFGNHEARLVTLEDPTFYVALIHDRNTSRKRTGDVRWRPIPMSAIRSIMGDESTRDRDDSNQREVDSTAPPPCPSTDSGDSEWPRVSCIMPTFNRRPFIPRAIARFQAQDYPNSELIVVDDGTDEISDLIPSSRRIKYIRSSTRMTIGAKRNIACEHATGRIIVFFDDDDWYSTDRISYQVRPIVSNEARITGLGRSPLYNTASRTFWTTTEALQNRMFHRGIISGTMAFEKDLWEEYARFPNVSVADDAAFLRLLERRGILPAKLVNRHHFVYMRHGGNTWRFDTGVYLDSAGWRQSGRPSWIPPSDPAFGDIASEAVARAARPRAQTAAPRPETDRPLVSCIMATGNRRPFLAQAMKHFQAQHYENKELIVIDDGDSTGEDLVPKRDNITYLRLNDPTPLGAKLNLGVERARGAIIQKLDDDDYYHPAFLDDTVGALIDRPPMSTVVGFDSFLVLIAETGELRLSGQGWCAGGTLCFYKQLWEKRPFRDVPSAVDWWFLKDHDAARVRISRPEHYILLRHQGNLWNRMGNTDVTTYFSHKRPYPKQLEQLVPEAAYRFYRSLIRRDARQGAPDRAEDTSVKG